MPIILSQCALALGDLWRALEDAQARVGEYRVEGIGELAGTVADQELDVRRFGVHEEVAGGLGGPFARGVGGDAEQVGAAAAMFEQDQGVDAFEVDGVDVEEVDGDDVFGLGGQELLPRWSAAARGGFDFGLVRDVPHGRSGDLVAEAGQFAVDPPVAPAGIVGGHAQHQGLDRSCSGWPPGAATSTVVPHVRHELAVPDQQDGRGDREDLRPAASGYQRRERRQPQATGRLLAHPWNLKTQNRALVPEHQQFRLLGDVTAQQQRRQGEQMSSDGIHRGQEHER
ncbi:hypothetical protein AB0K48_14490 [Nonomuraea sp. NPDC055795]